MNDQEIARLREQIAAARDGERAVALTKLGWAYLQAYVDARPGSGLILHYLEEGVAALDQGRLLLSTADPARAQAEATLGNYHASQGTSYWCEGDHVDKAFRLLRAALDSGSLVPVMADIVRFHLARVHLSRLLAAAPSSAEAELGPARELLLGVAERSITQALGTDSKILLAALARPSRASLDLAVAVLRSDGEHLPLVGNAEFDPKLTGRVTRRYPHTLVARGSTPAEPLPSARRRAAPVDVQLLRREAWSLLPATYWDDAHAAVQRLLADDELPWLDRFLAVAAVLVDSAQPATTDDHLLLALGYLLRSRHDTDGWAETAGSVTAPAPAVNGDLRSALANLLAALAKLVRLPVLQGDVESTTATG
ncbi:hypothetical protein ABZ345_05510 [Lentzea sp. NPDC005914]|uniref:hypothetical protein n=1 Tax=Lentzea sp. NPDC005914 TaxID=3154572 RepID=UPI0033CDB3C0